MEYIKLIKLLYLADRESFIETGYPITGAKMVSMDRGPVLSEILNLITWGHREPTPWDEAISVPQGYQVSLLADPGEEELSQYESDLLEQVFARFGSWDRWDLVDYTHELPEWSDPSGSSLPIDARVILQEAGRSDEEIHGIASQVEAVWGMKHLGSLIQ
jgi:uncharacterized phage-associated protein